MQKGHAAALVRNPATPPLFANQPRSIGDPNFTDSDAQSSNLLTPEQDAALSELLSFDEAKILTWLTILRSIGPGFQYRAGRGCISSSQLDALSTLKDFDDSDISAWLNNYRLSCQ